MSQSKKSKIIAILVVIAFLVVSSFQIRSHLPSCEPQFYPLEHEKAGELRAYKGCTRDASITYAPIIDGKKEVTDWHSSLYMYECRAVLSIAKCLGFPADGMRIQISFYYFHLGLLLAYVSALMYLAISRNLYLVMLFVPLCLSMSFMFEWMALGLDFFFFVHFCILCCTAACLCATKDKRLRLLLWILIVICLFHAVNYRKNAILIVPLITYMFVFGKQKASFTKYGKLFQWVSITALVALFTVKIVPWALPVRSTNPTIPMLSSDLRIAAVLRGEQAQLRAELLEAGGDDRHLNHEYCDSLTAYWGGELRTQNSLLIPGAIDIYMKHWRQHFGCMLMSRFIQTVEFYCGGIFPRGQRIISRIYPAVDSNTKAWQFLMRLPDDIMYGRIMVLLAGMIAVRLIVLRRWKDGRWTQPWDKPTAVPLILALTYAGSFALVPPTADARYLAPGLFIIWNVCWTWVALTVNRFAENASVS